MARNKRRSGTTHKFKYVFVDVVGFSTEHVEQQAKVVEVLNGIIRSVLKEFRILEPRLLLQADRTCLLLPTGDGVCIVIFERKADKESIHLEVAEAISKRIYKHNRSLRRSWAVRIGVNEHTDQIIIDINGRENISGAGINNAQRIMQSGDPGQIIVGGSVHAILEEKEGYEDAFVPHPFTDKHGRLHRAYRYWRAKAPWLGEAGKKSRRTAPNVPTLDRGLDALGVEQLLYDDKELHDALKGAKSIRVLKTFFPEDEELRDILEGAYTEGKKVDLYLMKPDSELLKLRSRSLKQNLDHGGIHVAKALCIFHDCCTKKSWNSKNRMVLFDHWPGSPLIQVDSAIYLGFYLLRHSSPRSPWLKVVRGDLFDRLKEQFKHIDKLKDNRVLRNRKEVEKYCRGIKDNVLRKHLPPGPSIR